MTVILVILVLAVINFILLYRHSLRDSLAINEYTQFLLLHPDVYANHREKFEAYLLTTSGKTSARRSVDALKAISRMAQDGRDKNNLIFANVSARNAVAERAPAQ